MWPGKSVKLFCLLKCLMTQILSVSRCGWSWSPVMISSSRNVHPSSHTRVSLLSNGERPCMCVTCVSWEISPKLIWTWPSGIRWRRKRLCAHFLLWELQNYSLLLNSHRLENAGSHKKKKKKIPHVQEQRRIPSKSVGGVKFHLDSNPLSTRDAQRAQTNLVCTRTQRCHRDWARTVFEYLLWRYGSAVACRRGRGSECSRPGYGISPLEGGHHLTPP